MGKAHNTEPDRPVDQRRDLMLQGAAPVSITSFIGRQQELAEIRSLLRSGKRLVTLIGIGGIGKTRLAVQAGLGDGEPAWARVCFVELASLTDPELVAGAVLDAVGGGSRRSPLEAAAAALGDAKVLLVLDSCEHVPDAARQAAGFLLARCPALAILATSRAPIGLEGELLWQVPPLSVYASDAVGDPGSVGDPGDVGAEQLSDAARLFLDRASHAQARFELDERTTAAVEKIVRGLDGIPLAIELAAARICVRSAGELAEGFDDYLRLLRDKHRSDPRHQTIRASLDWSHELLTDRERRLFARLSIFAGGFDLEAAAAVCVGGIIDADQLLDEVQGLVAKSLLTVERTTGATRFRLLDFVRQYAAEHLTEAGERAELTDRHRTYFRALAERADREYWAFSPIGRARLDEESPNLRAAIDDGCANAPDDALAMVGALGLYWRVRGRLAEGAAATEQSLAAASPAPSPQRALALAKLSVLAFWLGDLARTQCAATSALEMSATIGDTRASALALGRLGALVILSDPAAGDPMLEQAVEQARTAGDDVALCDALASLAISYFARDDPDSMRGPVEETLRLARAIGHEDDVRWCLWCLAQTDFSAGDLAGARAHAERAASMMPDQDPFGRYCAVEVLSLLDAYTGASDAARERAAASLEESKREGLRLGTGVLMHALCVAAFAAGDLERAVEWATELHEQAPETVYFGWHVQEILMGVALVRDDAAQAKLHAERLRAAAEPLNNRRAYAIADLGLARALLLERDDQRAESTAHEALKTLIDQGWRIAVIDALDLLAEIALYQRRHERAVRLMAAADKQRSVLGLVAFAPVRERIERHLATARTALGEESLRNAVEQGARLSLKEAIAYAQRGRGQRAGALHGWASLSPVERQVVRLAAQGLSNPDIAQTLFISRNTVKVHLSHAYAKLGVANRTELARLVVRHAPEH